MKYEMNESSNAMEKKMNRIPTMNFCRRFIFNENFVRAALGALFATPFEFCLAIETDQFLQK
jgi:hypothetical protein